MEVTGRELNAAMLTEYPPGKQKRPDLSTGAFFTASAQPPFNIRKR
jgi:hypothetical protein